MQIFSEFNFPEKKTICRQKVHPVFEHQWPLVSLFVNINMVIYDSTNHASLPGKLEQL